MDAFVNNVPTAVDTAGRVASREVAMVDSGDGSEVDRIQLAVDQGVLGSALDATRDGLRTAYANTHDRQLRADLDASLEAARAGEHGRGFAVVAAVAERSWSSTADVSTSTQQTTAATQEITASAAELSRTADELEALVGTFRLS